jgi:hypothetical protein
MSVRIEDFQTPSRPPEWPIPRAHPENTTGGNRDEYVQNALQIAHAAVAPHTTIRPAEGIIEGQDISQDQWRTPVEKTSSQSPDPEAAEDWLWGEEGEAPSEVSAHLRAPQPQPPVAPPIVERPVPTPFLAPVEPHAQPAATYEATAVPMQPPRRPIAEQRAQLPTAQPSRRDQQPKGFMGRLLHRGTPTEPTHPQPANADHDAFWSPIK